ncbi:hypothetical protein G9A89_004392 [Geosiphon pyriformis]|nr:hypothetical protein G9A89_004392 [Geosiphon pyriformis]
MSSIIKRAMIHPGCEATPATIFSLTALICLFLVNISVPITQKIAMFEISLTNKGEFVSGLWGLCTKNGNECTKARLGFQINNSNSSSHSFLGYLLTFHIIALGLALALTFIGGCAHSRARRDGILIRSAIRISLLAIIVNLISFIADLIIYKTFQDGRDGRVKFGNGGWLMVISLITTIFSFFAFFWGQWLVEKRSRASEDGSQDESMGSELYPEKLWRNEYQVNSPNTIKQPVAAYPDFEEMRLMNDQALTPRYYQPMDRVMSRYRNSFPDPYFSYQRKINSMVPQASITTNTSHRRHPLPNNFIAYPPHSPHPFQENQKQSLMYPSTSKSPISAYPTQSSFPNLYPLSAKTSFPYPPIASTSKSNTGYPFPARRKSPYQNQYYTLSQPSFLNHGKNSPISSLEYGTRSQPAPLEHQKPLLPQPKDQPQQDPVATPHEPAKNPKNENVEEKHEKK